MHKALAASCLALCLGCTRPGSTTPAARGEPSASASAAEAPPPAESAPPQPPSGPWRDSVVAMRYREAASLIDALPEEERGRPEMRFVRASIAASLRDHETVRKSLDGLEMPLLSAQIARLRAEAALEVGPYDLAARHYRAQQGVPSLIKASIALEKAGDLDEARKLADAAVARAKGNGQEASARAQRMRVADARGDTAQAAADARHLLLEAPESPGAAQAEKVIARLDPSWQPTASEALARAEKLASAGKGDAVVAELARIPRLAKPPADDELARRKGHLLYKVRRYEEAARELDRYARKHDSAHERFMAARALSRAHRDAEAVDAYERFVKAHPKSDDADEASYLRARLLMLLGRLDEAAHAYGSYLRKNKKGKHRDAAVFEQALVQLMGREPARARATLGTLAHRADGKQDEARLRELEGLAALRAGDDDGARASFLAVIKESPLSFWALAARARLAQMKGEPPPHLDIDATAGQPPTDPRLPPQASLLHQLGLDQLAEDALRPFEGDIAQAAGSRGPEALCAVYGKLTTAQRRFRIAQDKAPASLLSRAPGPANRWAWECLFPTPYADIAAAAEKAQGLPQGLVHAIMRQESAFDPDVTSPAFAVGLLQLLPQTARALARKADMPFDDELLVSPPVNIDLGARYLAMLLSTWKGSLPLAIASYNAGPRAVSSWVEHGPPDVDVWVARIPYGETRTYVARVMGNLARYAYLSGGEQAVPPLTLSVDTSLRADEGAF